MAEMRISWYTNNFGIQSLELINAVAEWDDFSWTHKSAEKKKIDYSSISFLSEKTKIEHTSQEGRRKEPSIFLCNQLGWFVWIQSQQQQFLKIQEQVSGLELQEAWALCSKMVYYHKGLRVNEI